MATIYYPKGSVIYKRDALSGSYEEISLAVSPNNILYFDTSSNLSALSASPFQITASQAETASLAAIASIASFASVADIAFTSSLSETAETASYLSGELATFVGMIAAPLITSGSLTPSGSIVTVGTGSVHLCTSPTGEGRVEHYELASKDFPITTSFLDVQYVIAAYNGGSPEYQIVSDKSVVDSIQTTIVCSFLMGAGGRLSYLTWDAPGVLLANKDYRRVQALRGIERESDLLLGVSGSTAENYITITAGRAWQGIKDITLPAVNSAVDRFVLVAHSASVWSGSTISASIFNLYDNGTNLASLGAGNFVVNWVYRAVGNLNTTLVQLGPSFGNLPDAVASQPPTPPSELHDVAFLTGRIILKNTTNPLSRLQQVDSAYVQTFVAAGITSHNDLLNKQGGTTDEYYHLTAGQHAALTAYKTVTGSYTILTTDSIVYANATSGSLTLMMPTASSVGGQTFRIKKVDSSGYEVVITSSVNIDYEKELRLSQRGTSVTLHSDTNQYWIH